MSKKTKHSINALAKILVSILTPLPPTGGGWGRLLLTALMLLAGQCFVFAQSNTSATPYLLSTHRYEVTTGGGDTYEWNIYASEDDANNETGATLLQGPLSIGGAASISIDIYFDGASYSANSSYFLVYSEFSSGSCTARRKMQIDVVANTFYIDAVQVPDDCFDFTPEETTFDNSVEDISALIRTVTVNFPVNMHKGDDDFYMGRWVVEGNISRTFGNYNFITNALSVATGDVSSGTPVLTGDETGFTLTVTTPDDADFTTDEMIISVQLEGHITSDLVLTLTLTDASGYAYGPNNISVTEDNRDGHYMSVITKWGIPNTSPIDVTP